jgi:carbamoyl-phosphate synthase large subunit
MPTEGTVFVSVQDRDKADALAIAARFHEIGFRILATEGTARFLSQSGVPNQRINKVSEGRPHVVDAVKNGEVQFVINTGAGDEIRQDGYQIRRAAIKFSLPSATTIAGADAMCRGIAALKENRISVKALQEYMVEMA